MNGRSYQTLWLEKLSSKKGGASTKSTPFPLQGAVHGQKLFWACLQNQHPLNPASRRISPRTATPAEGLLPTPLNSHPAFCLLEALVSLACLLLFGWDLNQQLREFLGQSLPLSLRDAQAQEACPPLQERVWCEHHSHPAQAVMPVDDPVG